MLEVFFYDRRHFRGPRNVRRICRERKILIQICLSFRKKMVDDQTNADAFAGIFTSGWTEIKIGRGARWAVLSCLRKRRTVGACQGRPGSVKYDVHVAI